MRTKPRLAALVLSIALVLAACSSTEPAPATTTESPPPPTTSSTTTSSAPPTTTTTTAAPLPRISLTARQLWDPVWLAAPGGVFELRNDFPAEASFALGGGSAGEWLLEPGETVVVDAAAIGGELILEATAERARVTALVDTRPAAQIPDPVVLPSVELALSPLEGRFTVLSSPDGRYAIEYGAELAAPADWAFDDDAIFRDNGWGNRLEVEVIDDSAIIPIQFFYEVRGYQSADGTVWRLFREESPETPDSIATHAVALGISDAEGLAPLGFWVTIESQRTLHGALLATVLEPGLDSIQFTELSRV